MSVAIAFANLGDVAQMQGDWRRSAIQAAHCIIG
jgi:hypothetical protein